MTGPHPKPGGRASSPPEDRPDFASLSRLAALAADERRNNPEGFDSRQERVAIDLIRHRFPDRLVRPIARAATQNVLRDRQSHSKDGAARPEKMLQDPHRQSGVEHVAAQDAAATDLEGQSQGDTLSPPAARAGSSQRRGAA